MWEILFIISVIFVLTGKCSDGHCVDVHSHIVSQGVHYIPGPNSCTVCLCEKGSPTSCKSVLCTQPTNCKSFQRGNTCCDFKCLDDILDGNTSYKDTYDLALPLFASVVFAVITLSLLFFVVHRFRRRKLHERHNRQISDDQRSLNSIGYIAGGLRYLPGNIGYLRSASNDLEFHYEETSNHLSLWKPPGNYFPRGEAPPPYEEAVRCQQIGGNARNSEVNNTVENNQNQQHFLCANQIAPHHQSTLINSHQSTGDSIRGESSNNDPSSRQEIAHITHTLNRSDDYQNIKVQDQQELVPLVEQIKAEVNATDRFPKPVQNNAHLEKSLHYPRPERHKKNITICEKVKCCEDNESNGLIGRSQPSEIEPENNWIKSNVNFVFHNFHLDKNNLEKTNEYQDAMLNTLSRAIVKDKASSKTLGRLNKLTQKCMEENKYENMGFSLQKQKLRSIPVPVEFRNEKNDDKSNKCRDAHLYSHKKEKIIVNANAATSRGYSEPKRAKEQIFLIDSKAAPFFLKDLKKSLEDCRDSSCSLLRDPNDVPVFTVCRSREMLQDNKNFSLHRTLPKNLKELVTDSANGDLGFNYSSNNSGNYLLHRSLPKHLNNFDANVSANMANTSVPIKNDNAKECPLLKPVNLHSSNPSTTLTSSKQNLIDTKRKDEQTPGSYQCLFFPQDDDDYRYELQLETVKKKNTPLVPQTFLITTRIYVF
ncbi:uncharacterized protein LOC108735319 isoform X2 [Agrilus planipennis]|uniref:Uncharacterized protein LOC108735319 isoform X2 n=1 Tax=Agrilus planipennis TaxID=224129 RepID=A0A1W4WQI2_AGRPL|nr:uncharacterized protein LOC108735319 isoform X2 [Agrilus planipennis]